MSIWVLIAIVFINGSAHMGSAAYSTQAACEAAKVEFIQSALEHNADKGSFTCTEAKIGTFS